MINSFVTQTLNPAECIRENITEISCVVTTTQGTALLLALLLDYIPSLTNRVNLPSSV